MSALTLEVIAGAVLVAGTGIGLAGVYIDKPGPGQRAAPRGEAERSNRAAAAAAIAYRWRRIRAGLAVLDAGIRGLRPAWRPAPPAESWQQAALRARIAAQPSRLPVTGLPNAAAGNWLPAPVPPADRPWLAVTPVAPPRPDVEDLDDTGQMNALSQWALTAPLDEIRAAVDRA